MARLLMISAALLVLACAAAALAADTPERTPHAWVAVGPAPADTDMSVQIALTLDAGALARFQRRFHEITDPRNPSYGKYYTRQALKHALPPQAGALAAVTEWARSNNLLGKCVSEDHGHCGDWVFVSGSAAAMAAAFGVRLSLFQHRSQPEQQLARTLDDPELPRSIRPHVQTIVGLQNFPEPRRRSPPAGAVDALPGIVTPAVLRKIYQVTDVFSGHTNSSQALAEFEGQKYSERDLTTFQTRFKLPEQAVRNVTGKGESAIGHVEANLDVQYIMVTGQGIPTDVWLESGRKFDLIGWAQYLLATPGVALVHSVSYGEDVSVVGADYAQRFNTELQKVGSIGISVLFASGDSGVYSRQGDFKTFHPDFPASLPAVTGVGATQITHDDQELEAASFSGGGFSPSSFFTRATDCPYQVDAASHFFNTSGSALPPSNLYDSKGCGYPDVSAAGVNFRVVVDDITISVGGTSASSPTVAGVIALLNDARMQAGRPPLGYLNPFLYQNMAAFNDIQQGTNSAGHKYGFTACAGWDPVSGVGTPIYAKLKAAALAI